MEKESLCWKCKKCTGFCPWSMGIDGFQPADGWKATPTKIPLDDGSGYMDSFMVESCPLFENDKESYYKKVKRDELLKILEMPRRMFDISSDDFLIKLAKEKKYKLEIIHTNTGNRQFFIHKMQEEQ